MTLRVCRPGGRHLRLMNLALLATVLLATAAAAAPADAATSEECLACHSDATLTMDRAGKQIPLHVDGARLGVSAHKDLSCTDCHEGLNPEELPHKPRIPPVGCLSCHDGVADKHAFHPRIATAGGTNGEPAISCKRCHGTHDVVPVAAPESPFHQSVLTATCAKCHKSVAEHLKLSAHGSNVAGAPTCLSCHEKPITPLRAGGESAELKLAQEKICLDCHLDNPAIRARMGPDAGFIAAFDQSVHGRALLAGNGEAATCIDCHGSHEMARGADPGARVSKSHIPGTCAACHGEIAKQYGESVHSAALMRGNADAPVCTDCHGEHNILNHLDPNAPVAAGNVSSQVCSPCHSSVKMSQKYGIATDRFKTFSDSYHGLALKSGSLEAANCASCHGAHEIRSSADPDSTVNKANLAVTCGTCHPGANQRFAVGQVHVQMTEEEEPLLYWIGTGYVFLILITVGGMFVHNGLDFIRKSIRKLKIRQGLIEAEEPAGHALYTRMTLNERIQHVCLMVSFVLLVVTGFMLSYPDAWWVRGIRSLSANVFEMRSLMHRVAAVVMVAASLYHILYLAFTTRGRGLLRDLLPGPGDLKDALRTTAWLVGLAREKPRFGRFGYVEKAEYWALVWGTMVMGVTGAIMWFENTFIGLLTKLGYDVARTIHFYEAWLAALAILVWHVYFVVFNPDVYPMNSAWLTGKLTEEEMASEHALELEAIKRKEEPPEQQT